MNAIKPFFSDAVLALNTNATRAKFLAESGKAGCVHAAAHVTMDELDPMSPALKLSPGGKESGDVLASDFLKLDLKTSTWSRCRAATAALAASPLATSFAASNARFC